MTDKKRQRSVRGGGSVFQTVVHGKKQWCASMSHYDEDGKRVFIRGFGATPSQAIKRRQANLEKRLIRDGEIIRRPKSPLLSKYAITWLNSMTESQMNENSKHRHLKRLENWVYPTLDKPIASIQPIEIEKLLYTTMSKQQAGDSAVVNVHKTLHALFNHAVRFGLLEKHPMDQVSTPHAEIKVRADDDKYISKRKRIARDLLKWLHNPECEFHASYAFILFMFLGLRRAELIGLTWDCISSLKKKNHATLTVKQQWQRNEVTKQWSLVPRTKQKKDRTIALPESFRLALLEQKRTMTPSTSEIDFVFTKEDGSAPDYHYYAKTWKTVLEKYMTLDPKRKHEESDYWRPHANRRVCTTILLEAGVNPETVRDLLGHSNVEMTEYYNSISSEERRKGAQTLETWLA